MALKELDSFVFKLKGLWKAGREYMILVKLSKLRQEIVRRDRDDVKDVKLLKNLKTSLLLKKHQ